MCVRIEEMTVQLNVVTDNGKSVPNKETVAQRVRRLQSEARLLAKDHTKALMTLIEEAQTMAAEIAEGGDAYPAGVRDLARRFAEDADVRLQTLEAINERNG
jgi:hypothetical protein